MAASPTSGYRRADGREERANAFPKRKETVKILEVD